MVKQREGFFVFSNLHFFFLFKVFLSARNRLACVTMSEEEDLFGQISQIQFLSLRLQRLSRSSVLNDVFHIW